MAGKFMLKKFAEINLSDSFFDSLKEDYPGTSHSTGFVDWFNEKVRSTATALVFDDSEGLGAFVYLKNEQEQIVLTHDTLPANSRIKIGTLCLAERFRGQRLGEGAIGLALWKWQKTKTQEIYVTVFEKHTMLIGLLERFGFQLAGKNPNGELVYIKSRSNINYNDPYQSFPFIDSSFQKAGYIIFEDYYHDTMFPYSELARTLQDSVALSAANGVSKVYVSAKSNPHYQKGEPVFIYRKFNVNSGKRYKSCVTSYCVITNVIIVKSFGRCLMSFDALKDMIGNKSVYDENDMREKYSNQRNMIVIEMLYLGYFGEGNNVNMDWLDNNGCWAGPDQYPTEVQLSPNQFKSILAEGKIDVSNVIID